MHTEAAATPVLCVFNYCDFIGRTREAPRLKIFIILFINNSSKLKEKVILHHSVLLRGHTGGENNALQILRLHSKTD
jgi:hypothetical protein